MTRVIRSDLDARRYNLGTADLIDLTDYASSVGWNPIYFDPSDGRAQPFEDPQEASRRSRDLMNVWRDAAAPGLDVYVGYVRPIVTLTAVVFQHPKLGKVSISRSGHVLGRRASARLAFEGILGVYLKSQGRGA